MISLAIKRKDGKAEAYGIYEDGKITVKKGSRIKKDSDSVMKGYGDAKRARADNSVVDENGVVLKDITFNSASMAAVFVMGTSTNGLKVWKTEKNEKLEEVIK